MILIEEDEDRIAEESCNDMNDETFKENTNYNNKPPRSPNYTKSNTDSLHKPRALANRQNKEHGIKFEI
jgi:hypothetical protein